MNIFRKYVFNTHEPGSRIDTEQEENLITELMKVKTLVPEDSKESLPPLEPPKALRYGSFDLNDTLDYLALNIADNKDVLFLLIFVAAIEGNEELTKTIKEKTNNFEGYDRTPEEENKLQNLVDLITEDPDILNRAFAHALKIKSITLMEYIIEGAENYFINPCVDDNQILKLVEDYKNEK